ncbi:hypothetical protein PMI07_003936 [Rhizobium sp. CF080]|uniref:hypothetical protein n=1 Tax=Rhizobium sp. (strain CF080) TaxID=1144310 RepID=UPI000271BD49|nr:hypothetical protein [Rhizobium sp. CF080]EUC00650.1 hypothetical protein PMI07_003936 [Rhizobium sp. CF080]
MSIVANQTIDALREVGTPPLITYERALVLACLREPPPFGMKPYGDAYRAVAFDPNWLAETLIANALAEGDGSSRLRDLAASTSKGPSRALVKEHSIDEARHARWYIAITELVFPGSIPASLRVELHSLIPFYEEIDFLSARKNSAFAHDITIDDLIQMNIAEIRTRIHQLIQRPILLAYAPLESQSRLIRLLDVLICDETKHIAYTAKMIDELSKDFGPDDTVELFSQRMRDFNKITNDEVSTLTFPSCHRCNGCAMRTRVN